MLCHHKNILCAVSPCYSRKQGETNFFLCEKGKKVCWLFVFLGNALKLLAARQEFPDAFFTCSYDGRVNEDIFLWWFRDHFLKKVPSSQNKPGILSITRGVHDITMQ